MPEQSEDVLASLVEERRKQVEEAQQERQRQVALGSAGPSDLVHMNDQGEVTFTILPSLLPYTVIDGNELISRMTARFGVSFKSPDFGTAPGQQRALELKPEQLAELPRYLKSSNLRITFVDGLVSLNIGKKNFIPPTEIKSISFTREHIAVSLTGRSDIAEMIAKECWELLWDLAKDQTPRTFDELSAAGLQIIEYANATTIDLGANPKELFRKEFVETIEKLFAVQDGLANNLRKKVYSDKVNKIAFPPVVSVDEIQFKIHVPESSGITFEAPLQLSVRRRSDAGTGFITLVTQLPYADHLLVVKEIVGSLSP